MLRFIIRRKWRDGVSGLETDEFATLDTNCPELEEILKRGGFGDSGYDYSSVAGVMVLAAAQAEASPQ